MPLKKLVREKLMRLAQQGIDRTAALFDPLFESLHKAIAAEEEEARTSRAATAAGGEHDVGC